MQAVTGRRTAIERNELMSNVSMRVSASKDWCNSAEREPRRWLMSDTRVSGDKVI